MILSASHLVLSLFVYAFLGWVVEIVVRFGEDGRLHNPGFLHGPIVPIYAVGAQAILVLTVPFTQSPLFVLMAAVAISTVVEFVGHVLLERLFGLVLWDYRHRFLNVQGRVCLTNSLAFGAGGAAVVYVLSPRLTTSLESLDPMVAVALASGLSGIVAADLFRSISAVLSVRPEIIAVRGSLAELQCVVEGGLQNAEGGLQRRANAVIARLADAFPSGRSSTAPPASESTEPVIARSARTRHSLMSPSRGHSKQGPPQGLIGR